MEIFGFLEGLSPWYWVAFAFVLGAIEMATMSFFLIWPALAALVMAWIVSGFDPSGAAQVALYAALSVGLTLVGRAFLQRFSDQSDAAGALNSRAAAMVGRKATVLAYKGGEGTVEIDGVRWKAVWDGPNAIDGTVEVASASGMILTVKAG